MSAAISYVAVPEDDMMDVHLVHDALDALAHITGEIENKTIGNPNKDSYTSLPAESLSSLFYLMRNQLDRACKGANHTALINFKGATA